MVRTVTVKGSIADKNTAAQSLTTLALEAKAEAKCEEGYEATNERKDYDTAIDCFTEAIRLDPYPFGTRAAKAYNGRGLAYHNKGQNGKAISDYTEAIRLYDDGVSAIATYYNRSVAYGAVGEIVKSKADLAKNQELQEKWFKSIRKKPPAPLTRLDPTSGGRTDGTAEHTKAKVADPVPRRVPAA